MNLFTLYWLLKLAFASFAQSLRGRLLLFSQSAQGGSPFVSYPIFADHRRAHESNSVFAIREPFKDDGRESANGDLHAGISVSHHGAKPHNERSRFLIHVSTYLYDLALVLWSANGAPDLLDCQFGVMQLVPRSHQIEQRIDLGGHFGK